MTKWRTLDLYSNLVSNDYSLVIQTLSFKKKKYVSVLHLKKHLCKIIKLVVLGLGLKTSTISYFLTWQQLTHITNKAVSVSVHMPPFDVGAGSVSGKSSS